MRGREFTALLAPLWLGACAFSTPCERGDWYAMGVADGRDGGPSTAIDMRAEQCALTPDDRARQAYEAGRTDGLDRFCSPDTAFSAGLKGYDIAAECTANVSALDDAYALGVEQRELRAELAALNAEIAVLDRRRQDVDSRLDALRTELAAVSPGDARSAAALHELESTLARYRETRADLALRRDVAAEALRAHRRTAAAVLAALD